jgi:hypothetical protein
MKNRKDLAGYFRDLGYKVGAEIGVANGDYSETLCKEIPGLKLYCVDLWQPYEAYTDYQRKSTFNKMLENTKKKLSKYDCHLIQAFSINAVNNFVDHSLDFVYIDANHNYSFVKEDIENWVKKVNFDGIVAGHDYRTPNTGVKEAVDEFVMEHDLKLHLTDDEDPISWYFTV